MQLFACPFPADTRPSREEDALPIAVSAELAVLLPRTQRWLVPNSGPMPFWEAAELFFSIVDSFLAAPMSAPFADQRHSV